MTQPQDYAALMQSALTELRNLRSKLRSIESAQREPIAIVGIGCRFPGGANDPESFWQLLQSGVDAITPVPIDRWSEDFYDPDPTISGKISTRYGGFIDRLQTFDADFFGITPREAVSLDPQQRSLLEVSWEALENAGIVPAIGSRAGVFIGISSNDYSQQLLTRDIRAIDAYLATGNSHSTAAGRLSYSLGLTGASVAIDTACSSSLVAVHLACQSLRNQECEFAIAGGVNRIISPEFSINFSQARMLAADGRCKTFDASADGFGRAEGCGVIVLKRLADAIAHQDNILAVIRGSAINQDGRSSGLTVPNGPAQVQVIRQALQNAGLDPAEVGYLEAHGTGTALGDPIELNAIGTVFGDSHSIDRPLQIGSVKTNLGHLEAAAGIAGLIKVVLTLQHQEIPPHLHLQTPTPHVDWDQLPLNVATRRTPQPLQVAGVSSFGFSGTNAHVVLGAYQAEPASIAPDRPLHLLTLSAKTPAALRELADRYAENFAAHPDRPLADICFSANTGRSQFAPRLCCIASSTEDCRSQLVAFAQGTAIAGVLISDSPTEADGWRSIWLEVAERYLRGEAIDWTKYEQTARRRVTLPTYPFQQQRYWFDRSAKKGHPLLGQKLDLAQPSAVHFENRISEQSPAFLAEHRVSGKVIFPIAAFIEMAIAAGRDRVPTGAISLSDFKIQQPIVLSTNETPVQLVRTDDQVEIFSHKDGWNRHAIAMLSATDDRPDAIDLAAIRANCPRSIDPATYYREARSIGFDYGESFQILRQIWQGDGQAIGEIHLSESSPYHFHPIALDAALQIVGAALPDADATYLPVGFDRFTLHRPPVDRLWSVVKLRTASDRVIGDLKICTETGEIIATLDGLQLHKSIDRPNWQDWLYEVEWRSIDLPPQSEPKPLLIFSDRQGFGRELAQMTGGMLVLAGDEFAAIAPAESIVNPAIDLPRLFAQVESAQIVYLWGLDAAIDPADCENLLHLVQAAHSGLTLAIVTQGAVSIANEALPGIAQSPLWGMGKVIALEHPSLCCRQIDLDPAIPLNEQIDRLLAELRSRDREPQIALRQSNRYAARLTRASIAPLRLTISTRGTSENLEWRPMQRRSPDPHEVEIQVQATGLNLIDVLDAIGMLPFERDGFGVECAGIVTAIGSTVTDLQVGDAVIALAPNSFSEFVTIAAALVVPKPDALSFEESATIPANFLTADYALRLADLKAGDRILIHAAATGTGLAAVQLAQKAGAEVWATASLGKWELLKSIGVSRIFNSRSLDFADEILHQTNGEGVDVVLNSLSGDFIAKSLAVLKPTGRFLEIGKRGVWSVDRVHQHHPAIDYHLIDLMQIAQQQPDRLQSMLRDLLPRFQTGELQPLPRSTFPSSEVVAAFRLMQQAKHTGKIVVLGRSCPHPKSLSLGERDFEVRSGSVPLLPGEKGLGDEGGCFLITGGLGGLGLQLANWLIQQGARQIVLVSRNAPTAAAQSAIDTLRQSAEVIVKQADVSDRSQLATVLHEIKSLRGIIHAAGVLDDGLLMQLDGDRFDRVLAPKVQGAWNLHELTHDRSLDFFVLFSSAASLLGSPGQANHVAANAFLDALAHHRQAIGLPALSINWGVWSEIGSATGQQDRLRSRGVRAIAPATGLQIFGQLLRQNRAQIGVIPIDWSKFADQVDAPFFADFRSIAQPQVQRRPASMLTYLQTEVAKVIGLPSAQLPSPQQGFFDLGMDSLMTVELKNRLETDLGVSLTATVIFEHPTIRDLAQHLTTLIDAPPDDPPDIPAPTQPPETSILAELEELETLLRQR